MAPGPRSRRQVFHSSRVSKKLTKMADVNSPKGSETRCQQKTEETQQSCKKIKVEQTMEDDTCRGWACCTDDNEIKVKHEPLEVEDQADSSDCSHDGRVTGEEDIKDPLFIDIDSTNVTSETSDCNQNTLDDVECVYSTCTSPGLPHRPRSTPLDLPSPSVLSDASLLSDSIGDESFSGFSDTGSDTRSVDEPSGSVYGVTRWGFAASAACRGKHQCVMHPEDKDGTEPSTSGVHGSPILRRTASSPGICSSSTRRWSCVVGAHAGDACGGVGHGVGAKIKNKGVLVWEDCDNFVPQIPAFDNTDVGVTPLFPYTGDDMSEIDYFVAYFDQPFMNHIVAETNRYALQLIASGILPASRMTRWKNTTIEEMYVFLALCMMMKHAEKHMIQDYWNKDSLVPTPLFNRYMSRDRFLLLLRCLHFENNDNEDIHDRLWKVQKIFSDLRGKFCDYFVPAQNVMIDESLVLFNRHLALKQYIPSKRHKFGLKFFVLCDCETGIVVDMILYSGTDVDIPGQDPHGFSGSVVKTLMEPLLNKGHILYTDNYYTSPLLTRFLLDHNTGACGTVKAHRREMPVFGIGIAVGECQLQKCDQMLSVRWKDSQEVNMLTTIHTGAMLDSGKVNFATRLATYKPDCIIDYNVNMQLVDKCDMMVGAVECVRKSVKWTKNFFFHLIDIVVLNCFNMYLVKSGKRPPIHTFSVALVSQLLVKYGVEGSVVPRGVTATMPHAVPDRLRGKEILSVHKLGYMPGTGSRQKGKRACIVCKNTQRRERKRRCICTWCVECKVPLCPVDCFTDYHTLAQF